MLKKQNEHLTEKQDLVFEKACPECKSINYTNEVEGLGRGYARIWFICKKCSHKYDNWWYGTGPSYGNQPLWKDILRKPVQAICICTDKGITIEQVYDVFEEVVDDSIIVIQNDNGIQDVNYPKENFIINSRKK